MKARLTFLILILCMFSGCAAVPVAPYPKTVEAEMFVKKEMGIPENQSVFFTARALDTCAVGTVSPRGFYNYVNGSICYDGTPEIYVHEVAHAYGADEQRAWQIARLYLLNEAK